MKLKHRPCFITFEGGEGSGKTTLIKKIAQALNKDGLDVLSTRAPGATPLGGKLRYLLLKSTAIDVSPRAELLLFLADRAQHVDEVILPALAEGKVVLCDRYNDSTLAYQAGARGFDRDWVHEMTEFASHSLRPNLTLYLDLDPEIGLARKSEKSGDRIQKKEIEFHQKVRNAFLDIARRDPKRFIVIDASLKKEQVLEIALEKVYELFAVTA